MWQELKKIWITKSFAARWDARRAEGQKEY